MLIAYSQFFCRIFVLVAPTSYPFDFLSYADFTRFIWVTFQIADICEETCDEGIRRALLSLPEDLATTYTRALRKIHKRETSFSLVQKIFKWMVCATRPLSMDEIKEAISISPLDKYLDPGKITTDDSKILKACANLAALDNDEGTIRFAHHSVKEFLLSAPADSITNIHFRLSDAECEVAEICITYLSFNIFETQISKKSTKEKVDFGLLASPFLLRESYFEWFGKLLFDSWAYFRGSKTSQLVSINWSECLKPMRVPPTQGFQQQFRLLGYVIENWATHTIAVTDTNPKLWSKLRALAFERELGFTFRPWGQFDTTKDLPYMSLVLWAIQAGHDTFLRLLLEPPTGPKLHQYLAQHTEEDGLPLIVLALRQSVKKGYVRVVKLLLEIGAEQMPNADTISIDSLCDIAAQNGHEAVMQLLLERGVSQTTKNRVFMEAANGGHVAVVRLLLEGGIEKCLVETALSEVAKLGYDALIKVLLRRDVNQLVVDVALCEAAKLGHDTVVKVFLENVVSDYIDTALFYATKLGHHAVVKVLLEGIVDKKATSTALIYAAEGGHDMIVKLLLESGVGERGAALICAAKGGHDTVVKLLLESTVSQNKVNEAFLYAAKDRHDMVVKLLLENGVDQDTVNRALLDAARSGHDAIVGMLLENKVDQDTANRALLEAAKSGYNAVVKLLLGIVVARDIVSRALYNVVRNVTVVKVLIESGVN